MIRRTENLLAEAEVWTRTQFAEWLARGLRAISSGPSDQLKRSRAFAPLYIPDSTDQLRELDACMRKELGGLFPMFSAGVALLGRRVQSADGPVYGAHTWRLVSLSATEDMSGAANAFLRKPSILREGPSWTEARRWAFLAGLHTVAEPELFGYVMDLKGHPAWSYDWSRWALEEMVAKRPGQWLEIYDQFRSDLVRLTHADSDAVRGMVGKVLAIIGLTRLSDDLPWLVGQPRYSLLRDLMFEAEDPIVEIRHDVEYRLAADGFAPVAIDIDKGAQMGGEEFYRFIYDFERNLPVDIDISREKRRQASR
jgi:hypothetical protein